MDLKQQMGIEFADSETKFTKEQWNDRYFRAETKIQYASTRMIQEDVEIQGQIAIYLKGKFVEPMEKHITWLSKNKLIKMVKELMPEKTITSLKRTPRKELLAIIG